MRWTRRVDVVTGGLRQRQWVRSGTGYLTGSDNRLHFGLGAATAVDELSIRWPSGQRPRLENLPINQVFTVTEPSFVLSA